ncbi:hypothetical protein HaLaN_23365 [Haematococcus lacustris]|uniref:Uncharacterized protein n=1 Tax=Haematococcus lacustris TaxID=44745 RepID=A0A699ZSU9_HAELA|nr:hypothetical protein HaLaN_23365 [Haematococcus lacustris]
MAEVQLAHSNWGALLHLLHLAAFMGRRKPDMAVQLAGAGAARLLLDVLRTVLCSGAGPGGSALLLGEACGLLLVLAQADAAACARHVLSGPGVALLLLAAAWPQGDSRVRRPVLQVIRHYVGCGPVYCEQLLTHGALPALPLLLHDPSAGCDLVLVQDDEAKQQLVQQGVLQLLVQAVQERGTSGLATPAPQPDQGPPQPYPPPLLLDGRLASAWERLLAVLLIRTVEQRQAETPVAAPVAPGTDKAGHPAAAAAPGTDAAGHTGGAGSQVAGAWPALAAVLLASQREGGAGRALDPALHQLLLSLAPWEGQGRGIRTGQPAGGQAGGQAGCESGPPSPLPPLGLPPLTVLVYCLLLPVLSPGPAPPEALGLQLEGVACLRALLADEEQGQAAALQAGLLTPLLQAPTAPGQPELPAASSPLNCCVEASGGEEAQARRAPPVMVLGTSAVGPASPQAAATADRARAADTNEELFAGRAANSATPERAALAQHLGSNGRFDDFGSVSAAGYGDVAALAVPAAPSDDESDELAQIRKEAELLAEVDVQQA